MNLDKFFCGFVGLLSLFSLLNVFLGICLWYLSDPLASSLIYKDFWQFLNCFFIALLFNRIIELTMKLEKKDVNNENQ